MIGNIVAIWLVMAPFMFLSDWLGNAWLAIAGIVTGMILYGVSSRYWLGRLQREWAFGA